ncbi:hypothetical protein Nwi_1812 [Nitrobacter winogradskyi Nb-255]|uniref:Uncharacterized protein n=2 Tax=Nitrobacter winogradskyi TaxID=913 RepID=Q3SRL8_NITWN|nr:hypothetical protein Nwi_1812 [Nitrobacter winogradskyi Nb-255]
MDVGTDVKGRLSSRRVAEGPMRAPGLAGLSGARWIDSHRLAALATADGVRNDSKAGRPRTDVNLIYAGYPDRKTEWRIGATNPTSDERAKFARQFEQMFSRILTCTGRVFEKLR